MSVELEEFLETTIRRARQHSGETPVKLGVPPSLLEEISEILAGDDAQVGPWWVLDRRAGGSNGDTFSVRSGSHIKATYWIPGLTQVELETYQALRWDGTPRERAQQLAEAFRDAQ